MKIKQIIAALHDAVTDGENVIIEGGHGVGKTQIIKEIFDHYYPDEWIYYSGSTMDAYLDFIGCPKEVNEDKLSYIKLIKPERFAKKKVRAIFIDEFNRSSKEVRNAVMELLQFKSVNGESLGLEVVWAAINPTNGIYDTELMDPAQFDRFHVHLKFPSYPEKTYFRQKFGDSVGDGAIEWWNMLDEDNRISPRRLETVLNAVINNGRPADRYLTSAQGPNKLIDKIRTNPILDKMKKLSTKAEKVTFFSDANNFAECKEHLENPEILKDYLAYLPNEKANSLIYTIPKEDMVSFVSSYCLANMKEKDNLEFIFKMFTDISTSNVNAEYAELAKEIPNSIKAFMENV